MSLKILDGRREMPKAGHEVGGQKDCLNRQEGGRGWESFYMARDRGSRSSHSCGKSQSEKRCGDNGWTFVAVWACETSSLSATISFCQAHSATDYIHSDMPSAILSSLLLNLLLIPLYSLWLDCLVAAGRGNEG